MRKSKILCVLWPKKKIAYKILIYYKAVSNLKLLVYEPENTLGTYIIK